MSASREPVLLENCFLRLRLVTKLHVRRCRVLRPVATDLLTKRDVRRVRTSSVLVHVMGLSVVLAVVSGAACMQDMSPEIIGARNVGFSSRTQ